MVDNRLFDNPLIVLIDSRLIILYWLYWWQKIGYIGWQKIDWIDYSQWVIDEIITDTRLFIKCMIQSNLLQKHII